MALLVGVVVGVNKLCVVESELKKLLAIYILLR